MAIATAPHSNSKFWNQTHTTWDQLAAMVESPADHKECGSYLLGTLTGKTRSKETIASRSEVTLDADTALSSLPDQVELVLGYRAIMHTTFRHTPSAPRYRVIIALDRAVTPAEYRTLTWVLMGRLGREQFDKGSSEPERYMFLPSHDPAHPEWYEYWVFEGDPVPVDELLASVIALVPDPDPEPVVTVEHARIPEEHLRSQVGRILKDLDALSDLSEGDRLPWPGEEDGVGWDRGGIYIASRLVEAGNSGTGYTLDDAKADWDEHAPPSTGSFDREHKWSAAVKHVNGRAMPYDAPEGDFAPTGERPKGELHSGQVRMAYRLAAGYAGRLLYVYGIGWHWWAGTHWAPDDSGVAERAVVTVLKAALAESVGGDKKLRTDATKCESSAGIAGVLSVASVLEDFAYRADMMDADPFLFNCANGTLDLRERKLRPHDPLDRITKVARGAYDPGARGRAWPEFLRQVLPDQDERAYFRRVIGQALYGGVREHLFPVLTGTGANGKGTAYGAIVWAWGDYATTVAPDMLMVSRSGPGGPEMMVLRGARLVVASELGRGAVLDDSLMKRLTGGDQLTARHLFKEPVTWAPTHQLLYVTNFKPQTHGDDDAVWRRMRVIPFNVVIPAEEQDMTLGETMMLHADAILTWAVEGYFDHADNGGMREPAAVLDATAAYQHDNDDLARFIEEQCEVGPRLKVTAGDLWQAWLNWSNEEGAEQVSRKALGVALTKRGFRTGMDREGTRLRLGISLLDNARGAS